jgi:hypothetical protein
MPSPASSRRNLDRYWNRVGRPRSGEESALIWRLTLQWWINDPHNPRTQHEWAKKIGVSQPYVSKMLRWFRGKWLDLTMKWKGWQEVTLNDLAEARDVRIRARARLAEEREWEQYNAEQRRLAGEQEGTYYEDESDEREESE